MLFVEEFCSTMSLPPSINNPTSAVARLLTAAYETCEYHNQQVIAESLYNQNPLLVYFTIAYVGR
jgi:hypothetical protein